VSITLDAEFRVEALLEALKPYGLPEIFSTDQRAQLTGAEKIRQTDPQTFPSGSKSRRRLHVRTWPSG
jgi:hypothetical protein